MHSHSNKAVVFAAQDGYSLKGLVWQHAPAGGTLRPVVIINPATSVRCQYYSRFADYLYQHDFDVLCYDYRGIGESRPPSLRSFEASWLDWGQLDFEAALQYVAHQFPAQPVYVVAHSVGGFLIGLAPSNYRVERVFTMGAQFAYWRDYAAKQRWRMLFKWHLLMPILAAVCGYFPGKRLGWLEDTPRGVVRDWTAPYPRFEDAYQRGRVRLSEPQRLQLVQRFTQLQGDTLALSLSDDEFGTVPAIQRLLNYYHNSPRTHLHLTPQAIGQQQVGHFAFFHSRFRDTLWPIPLAWLKSGRLPENSPGELLTLRAH